MIKRIGKALHIMFAVSLTLTILAGMVWLTWWQMNISDSLWGLFDIHNPPALIIGAIGFGLPFVLGLGCAIFGDKADLGV